MGFLRSRAPTRLLSGLAIALLALAVSIAALAATLLWTSWGRARVCAYVNEAVSAQIMGQLVVEGFDQLGFDQVTAHGIKIFAPDGVPAIEAERATIEFDPTMFWSGRYGWTHARIERARVRVSEDARGRINMEEAFRGRPTPGEDPDAEGGGELALRSMVTEDCSLLITGGTLPTLRLRKVYGVMSIDVARSGQVQIRFDEYRGTFAQGLPTGVLEFRDVSGHVQNQAKRLLRFEGGGRTQGAEVRYSLDIFTEPRRQVTIDARFPERSPAATRTAFVAAWSKLSSGLELNVHYDNDDD